MHLLLTDRMACPRCGPAFGMILRTDQVEDRRVLSGGLGCPNCRELYPVSEGGGDLRPPPRMTLEVEGLRVPEEDRVSLVHALLGVTEGPGEVALVGRAARYAPGLASRIPGLELVAIHPATLDWTESPGVSRLVCGTRLPFMDRVFRGVVLEGPVTREGLREAARVLGRGHRTVVLDAPAEAAPTLMAAGLMVGVDQDGVVVAHR